MAVPRTNTVCSSRSFSVCAPVVWNSLPPDIQLCCCLKTFKSKLKTFLFRRAFAFDRSQSASATSDFMALYKWFYLLTYIIDMHVDLMYVFCSITGLCRVNGVRRSCAKTWNFNSSPKSQLYLNRFDQSCQIWFGSNEQSRLHVGATYMAPVIFLICLFNGATAHTCEPIFAHNDSKDAVWCKKDPVGMRNVKFWTMRVFNPKNTPKIGQNGQLPAKMKCRITPKR